MSYTENKHLDEIINKKVLFLDLETTNIIKTPFGLPPENEYPDFKSNEYDNVRILSLGYLYVENFNYDYDIKLENISEKFIKPSNFNIPEESIKIHGITQEIANIKGKPIKKVLKIIGKKINNCDYIIGYNVYFDVNILLSELYRVKINNVIDKILNLKTLKSILCIGILSSKYAKPINWKPNTYNKYQMPKQIDVYKTCFNVEPENIHNAKSDVLTMIKILFWIYNNKNNHINNHINDKLITFGKYKNKTYDYIIKNHLEYCEFVLNQTTSKNNDFINFQKYIKENNIFKNKYDINKLKNINGIICSELAEYMKYDENIKNLIFDSNIIINKITDIKTIENYNLPADIFGIFIDYLIRYEISKYKLIEFIDNQTNLILSFTVDGFVDEKTNKIIDKSYIKMKKYKATLTDILNVSISHAIFFNKPNAINYVNYNNNIISNELHNNIILYIQNKLLNKEIILCNPTLGDSKLNIGADLIIDDELIDIKTSKYNIGNNINDFIQLFIYAGLYYKKSKIYINKLTIFNPLYLTEYSIEINNTKIINKILKIIKNYKIGSENNSITI